MAWNGTSNHDDDAPDPTSSYSLPTLNQTFNLNVDLFPPPSNDNNNPTNNSQLFISFDDINNLDDKHRAFLAKSKKRLQEHQVNQNNTNAVLSSLSAVICKLKLIVDLIPPPSDDNNNPANVSQPPIFFVDDPPNAYNIPSIFSPPPPTFDL